MNLPSRLISLGCGLTLLTCTAHAKPPAGWTTDAEAALATAKKEGKFVLLEFTGSDWCAPCIMMQKKVFSKKEFIDAASKDFILVYLDFPKKDSKLAEKNEPLAKKFKITSFPTIILLDKNGKELSRFPATDHPSVDAFLSQLKMAKDK